MFLRSDAIGARIVRTPGRLHAITGTFLRRYISDDEGRSWSDAGDLVSPTGPLPFSSDVTTVGDTVVVSFLTWYPLEVPRGTIRKGTRLHVLRVAPDYRAERIIAEYPLPALAWPETRLAFHDGVLHLIVGRREDASTWAEAAGIAPPERGWSFAQFLHAMSLDGGRSWTPLEVLPSDGGWTAGRFGRVGNYGYAIPSSALAIDSGGLLFVWGAKGLYGQSLPPGGRWSMPDRVDRNWLLEQSYELGHRSIAVMRTRAQDVVVWIDTSHPRRGRRSNDLRVGISARTGQPGWKIRRITPPGLYTNCISTLIDKDTLYVLRAGKRAQGIGFAPYDSSGDLSICTVPLQLSRGPTTALVAGE